MATDTSILTPIGPFDPASWPETLSEQARTLLEYWVSKCEAGAYPRRSTIEPSDISDILPYVFIVETLEGEEADYRFILLGTAIVDVEGECTGQALSDLLPDRARYAKIWKQYNESYEGRVNIRRQTLGWRGKQHIEYEVVLLPLRGGGDTVDYLIGTARAERSPE